jgi:hypothetical protein
MFSVILKPFARLRRRKAMRLTFCVRAGSAGFSPLHRDHAGGHRNGVNAARLQTGAPACRVFEAALTFCIRALGGWTSVRRAVPALLFLLGVISARTAAPPKATPPPATPARPAEPAAKSPWGRVVMIGASATAGFTESEPLGGPTTPQYRLSRYVEAALLAPHEPVQNLASAMFFIQPDTSGRYQIDETLKARPTLVIGIDFLFWFCYGDGPTGADRLRRFEQGLALLEAVQCPLVIGDLPDASGAAERMLPKEQVPTARTLTAANRRLKDWAANRKQVVIVSLSGFMRSASANQALTIHGYALAEGKTRVLLQDDRLHPSPPGCAVLTLAILDSFKSARPALPANEVRWDPKEIFRQVNNPQER